MTNVVMQQFFALFGAIVAALDLRSLLQPLPLLLLAAIRSSCALSSQPIVVLIAFDGIPHHYTRLGHSPTLHELQTSSTTAEWMLRQFPARTLPNLHSIATGLYPEVHGVLGDQVFDDSYQCVGYGEKLYTLKKNTTPIWTLNEMTGNGRYSAVIAWPGAEFAYQERAMPAYRLNATDCMSWQQRVDYAVDRLTVESRPANLVLLHFEARENRTSLPIPAIMQEIDQIVGYYFGRLEAKAIRDQVNTIILSDHTSPYESVNVIAQCQGPRVITNAGCQIDLMQDLREASVQMNAFKSEQYAQIKYNYEAGEISQPAEKYLDDQEDKIFVHPTRFLDAVNNHNRTSNMFPLFIANGPLFEQNFKAPPFENVDIYALISRMLNLTEPAIPINGSAKRIEDLLKVENQPVYDKIIAKVILFSIVGVLLFVCAWYILRVRKQERLRL